jgi:ATP-binding cassette subfamily F protein 3
VLGELDPLAGEVRLGAGLKVGYFAQAHDGLHPENTVLDELMLHKKGMTVAEARDYLAQYLFRGEDVFKQVEMLSGGERGRLALAILALDGANFLLLDEPTNHLDIPAQEVLQEGLDRFGGTLLLVSHDRYLVDRLATRIWDLRDGRLHVFDGTYQEYVAAREEAVRASASGSAETGHRGRAIARSPSANGAKAGRDRTQDLARLEQEIAQIESFLADCERKLQEESAAQRHEEVGRIGAEYAATQAQLDALLEEWTAMAAQET